MSQNLILKVALLFYEMGLWVVPCNGKIPVVKAWQTRRLTEAELREHLSGGTLNIAIALHESDWIDIECDSKKAEKKLKKIFGGRIPKTPTYKSKRGKHYIFLRPPGLPRKAVIVIDGIEFRIGNGKGVLSVFPPSVHESGVRYKWVKGLKLIDDLMPTELPQEVVELLKDSSGRTSSNEKSNREIAEGDRNSSLFNLGCRLRESGLDVRSIESALLSENAIRCKPPLSEEEVMSISRSAAKEKAGLFSDEMSLWHTSDQTAYATISIAGHFDWPSTRHARRSETTSLPRAQRTCSTVRRRFAGLRSLPKRPHEGSPCPAPLRPATFSAGRSPDPALSDVSLDRSEPHRTLCATDSTSGPSRRSSDMPRESSAPETAGPQLHEASG